MVEREDALAIIRRALGGQQRECVVHERLTVTVIGRVAAKGLADELHDRGYLVVDGTDGRAHYLKLPNDTELAELPLNGIVEAKPTGLERPMDRNIATITKDGVYKTTEHLRQLLQDNDRDPQSTVKAHVRRLESLHRSGIVERIDGGAWKVPPDLLQRAQQHDAQKGAGLAIGLRSHLSIDQQVRAVGATWLDKQRVDEGATLPPQGFGAKVLDVMHDRVDFLAEQGLADFRGQRPRLARNLLAGLRDRELATVGKALQDQTGLNYRPVQDGGQTSGIYRRSLQLASGRFAMLDDGVGFSLVPWRPVIEERLGQQVSAIVRGRSVAWEFQPQRGIGL